MAGGYSWRPALSEEKQRSGWELRLGEVGREGLGGEEGRETSDKL